MSYPLDDDGICRDQESNLDLWFRTPLCSFHYTIAAWHPRQDLNPHLPGRNRRSCPLNDGGVEHHQGVEPCRSGLQPDLLSQSCGAWQGTEESNLAANRGWNPVRFTERAPHGALAGNRTQISAVPRQRPHQMDLEGEWWTGRESNPQPPGCKPGALPVELPSPWCAAVDLNHWPPACRAGDLPADLAARSTRTGNRTPTR